MGSVLVGRVASWLGLVIVYVATAKLGLALDPVGGFATLVWPPTGIALAALVRGGPWLGSAVTVGAFAANLWSGAPWPVALGIAVGNTFEAVLGSQLLRRMGYDGSIRRVRQAFGLLAAALLSPLVSASLGVLSLWQGEIVAGARVLEVWQAWWLGDVLGALLVAPVLLNWVGYEDLKRAWRRAPEAVALSLTVLGSAALSFSGDPVMPLRRPHMVFPALIWAALRFSPSVASVTVLAVAGIAIVFTALGAGPYVAATLHENLTQLQGFMGTVALTGIFLAAANAERSRALRLLAEEHARLHAIAEATSDSIIIKDLEGRYVLINPAFARVLGRETEAVIGKSDADFFPAEIARSLRDNDRAAVASEAGLMSLELIPVRGDQRTFSSAKAPYRVAGELVGNISISRDVTQQKSDERALREALGVRDEFLAIASHELRTPLAALTLQVSGLERVLRETNTSAGESRPELQRARRAVAQVDRLVRLVENLLDVSRISTGRLRLQPEAFDLAELVPLVVAGLRDQATRAGCVTTVSLAGAVMGTWDRSRIEQVITNLLTNAFKYGAGKPVDVSVEASEASAVLRVRDQGIGIVAEPLDRVFERFERVATGHHQKSLGVGLYIARQVIDAHAGTICVESTSAAGTTFMVELPRQPLQI